MVYSIGAEVNPLNLQLLKLVQEYFDGVGSISRSANMYFYEISSPSQLVAVRNHFERYPLQTTKFVYFKLWSKVLDMFLKGEHLTDAGFDRILSIKSVFKEGLGKEDSALYKAYFSKIVPITKPAFVPSTDRLDHN